MSEKKVAIVGGGLAGSSAAATLAEQGFPVKLITYNDNEYENLALRLANNKDELFELKSKLLKQIDKSPLFNSKLFTQNLEEIYKKLTITHIPKYS